MQRTSEELRKQKFVNVKTIECLAREIELLPEGELEGPEPRKRALSSKVVASDRGHTGFLTFAVSL